MSTVDAAITVTALSFAYDTTPALHEISFSIAQGSVTALVGPNGAGKTTLMRCLAGLEPPDHGAITLAGVDVVADPRAARARMGFLQDFFGLYDRLSVRRCLEYGARSRAVDADVRPARIATVAASLGLEALLDRPASALSRGQRQRVAIATAIVHRPPVLILDEPAAGLDPEARAELAMLLRSLASDGMTLLISSHILAELEDYSTDVLMLEAGRVIGHGPLAEPERRLALVLAGGGAEAASALLSAQPGVGEVTVDDNTVVFTFAGDRFGQASLLGALVAAGVPVCAFEERRSSMQDIYLARLRAARAA